MININAQSKDQLNILEMSNNKSSSQKPNKKNYHPINSNNKSKDLGNYPHRLHPNSNDTLADSILLDN